MPYTSWQLLNRVRDVEVYKRYSTSVFAEAAGLSFVTGPDSCTDYFVGFALGRSSNFIDPHCDYLEAVLGSVKIAPGAFQSLQLLCPTPKVADVDSY